MTTTMRVLTGLSLRYTLLCNYVYRGAYYQSQFLELQAVFTTEDYILRYQHILQGEARDAGSLQEADKEIMEKLKDLGCLG